MFLIYKPTSRIGTNKVTLSIIDLMTDSDLFGGQFSGDSWKAWRTLLSGFYGLPLEEDELETFKALTGREKAPEGAHNELWLAIGRRGGKSQQAALLSIYEAVFIDHAQRLSPGEVATVLVLASDRKQSRVVFRYITGLLHSNPMLESLIEREDKESIELSNRSVIEIGTASFRTTRGYTLAAVIADEIAFWRTEDSANPDAEIIAALRPALATLGGKLIALSSPYSRRGELWRMYQRYHGQDDPSILVAKAPSRVMNPLLPESVIKQAKERDLASALAEYEAEFRNDIEEFIGVELLYRLTRSEPYELPPMPGPRYLAFTDPSGGGADGFSLCIGHREDQLMVIDLLTERTRTSPAEVVKEYSKILKLYGIHEVTGDRYAGQWVAQEFERHGITYLFSEQTRTEIYQDFLAIANSGGCELPPTPKDKLITQFSYLERRTTRSSRDIIDHAPGTHDDLANAAAGLIAVAAKQEFYITNFNVKWAT